MYSSPKSERLRVSDFVSLSLSSPQSRRRHDIADSERCGVNASPRAQHHVDIPMAGNASPSTFMRTPSPQRRSTPERAGRDSVPFAIVHAALDRLHDTKPPYEPNYSPTINNDKASVHRAPEAHGVQSLTTLQGSYHGAGLTPPSGNSVTSHTEEQGSRESELFVSNFSNEAANVELRRRCQLQDDEIQRLRQQLQASAELSEKRRGDLLALRLACDDEVALLSREVQRWKDELIECRRECGKAQAQAQVAVEEGRRLRSTVEGLQAERDVRVPHVVHEELRLRLDAALDARSDTMILLGLSLRMLARCINDLQSTCSRRGMGKLLDPVIAV